MSTAEERVALRKQRVLTGGKYEERQTWERFLRHKCCAAWVAMEIAEGGAGSDDTKERRIAVLEENAERDNQRIALLEEHKKLLEKEVALQQEEIAVHEREEALRQQARLSAHTSGLLGHTRGTT